MQRPDIDSYEAMAAMGRVQTARFAGEWREVVGWWPTDEFDPRIAIPELCTYAKHLEAILRDWLAACPETCGQCEGVRKRAEEAVR